MALVHVELADIIAVFKDYASRPVLIPLRPVALVKETRIDRNAVAKTVAFIRRLTPLTFVKVSCSGPSQRSELPLAKVKERNWAVVELRQTIEDFFDSMRHYDAFFELVELHW